MGESRLEIDLGAVSGNVAIIRSMLAPGARMCAVLKQDAYGMGARRVAKRLEARAPVDLIAVFCADEAAELIEAGVTASILILEPTWTLDRMSPLYRHALLGRLHLTIHSAHHLEQVIIASRALGIQMPMHVQVDTGMARGGCLSEEALGVIAQIRSNARLRLAGIMTHFATARSDVEYMTTQSTRFAACLESAAAGDSSVKGVHAGLFIHSAGTVGTFCSRDHHHSLVRIGQGLYGQAGLPEDAGAFAFADRAPELKPAVRWTSSIVHAVDVPSGWRVGYGGAWRVGREGARIAIVPVGYALGFPQLAGARARKRASATSPEGAIVRVSAEHQGKRLTAWAPVVGRVSMDQITIDVSKVPLPCGSVGAEVEIIGAEHGQPNSLDALARAGRTLVHELLCSVGHRAQRLYIDSVPAPRVRPRGTRSTPVIPATPS